MLDPVVRTLNDLDDTSLYEREDNVPVFAPHKRKKRVVDANGAESWKEVSVTEADLEEIVANANARTRRGNLIKGTLGHFRYGKDVPETSQPVIAAYYKDFRVGTFGPDATPAILATRYIRREYLNDVRREFPERSADYYQATKEITAIASLKRDADLDLGTISYARDVTVVRYLSESDMDPDTYKTKPADEEEEGQRVEDVAEYAEGAGEDEVDPNPPPMPDATDPTVPPDADAPDAGFLSQFERCMQTKYPHLDKMHASYAASAAPAQQPPPAASPMSSEMPPEASNGKPPMAETKTEKVTEKVTDKPAKAPPPMQHAKEVSPAQFARLEADLRQATKSLHATQTKLLREERRGELAQYARCYVFDVEEELHDVMDVDGKGTPMSPEQYERHLTRIRKYSPKELALADLPDVDVVRGREPDPNAEPDAAEESRVMQYMREEMKLGRHHEHDDALKHIRGGKSKTG